MSWRLPDGYRTQVALATYVPGPLNPPEYYYQPVTLACGHSEEDCDGFECRESSDEDAPPEPDDSGPEWDAYYELAREGRG